MMHITRSTVLKPSPAPCTGAMVPLTIFDYASTDDYIPVVFAWDALSAPTNDALKDGLLATIARFPHLAGRFTVDGNQNKCIHLNNAGVLVVEATDLADVLIHASAHINQLYPKADKNNREDEPIFQVQLTRYTCGGLVIGAQCHHHVADGQSMSVFYTAWATAVRTNSAILPSPFLDRVAVAVPRSPPTPSFDHRNIEFKGDHNLSHNYGVVPDLDMINYFTVHFPEEFVTNLKARVGGRCSTFQCLLAHVWKKVTVARDLAPDDFTQVRVAVNCRGRTKLPVPMDFFGNMVLWAFPRMQVKDLLSATYTQVVSVIRNAVAHIDDEYIQSFIDFGENVDSVNLKSTAATPGMVFCPDLEVDSWLGFRFHNLDFGGGPPCAFLAPDMPIDGLMVLVPSCSAKVGVDLFMALEKDNVQVFKQICYSMD